MADQKPRGGYREGSGRKPAEPGGRDIAFRLYPRHVAMIDRYARTQAGTDNRSAALRHMIERLSAIQWQNEEKDR